jgi:hypothetical protein
MMGDNRNEGTTGDFRSSRRLPAPITLSAVWAFVLLVVPGFLLGLVTGSLLAWAVAGLGSVGAAIIELEYIATTPPELREQNVEAFRRVMQTHGYLRRPR